MKKIYTLIIGLIFNSSIHAQGFSTAPTNWPIPIGGQQASIGNIGFNALDYNSSYSSTQLNDQTWSTADINGDGKSDLIVSGQIDASGYTKVFSPASNPYWKVYLNNGSGFSTTAINWPVPVGGQQEPAGNLGFNALNYNSSYSSTQLNDQTWSTADINGDGKPDLIVSGQIDASGYTKAFSPASNPYWKVYLNNGSGFSTTAINWTVPVGGQQEPAGNLGFNALNYNSSYSSTQLNDQTWSTADINGDNKPDLIVSGQIDASGYTKAFSPASSPYWKVYLNTGSGFSSTAINWAIPVGGKQEPVGNLGFNATDYNSSATSTQLNDQTWSTADINGDGKSDLIVSGQIDASGYTKVFNPASNPYWKVYLNTGTGFSTTAINWPVPIGGQQEPTGSLGFNALNYNSSYSSTQLNDQTWSTADIDGDGKLDLIVSGQIDASGYTKVFGLSSNPYWNVYLNNGSGFSATVINWALPVGGGQGSTGNLGFNLLDYNSSYSTPQLNNQTWSTADINGDGKSDLIVSGQIDASGYTKAFSPASNPYWVVYLNTSATSGIRSTESDLVNFNIYPNPTNGKTIVEFSKESQNLIIEVYDMVGTKILHQINLNEIDLSNQSPGIYFIRIGSITKKIVKE